MAINPFDIINFERTDRELQEFAIFCVCVAGRKSTMIAPKVHEMVNDDYTYDILMRIQKGQKSWTFREDIKDALKRVRMGQYERIAFAIYELFKLNLRTCTLEELENVPGIGPKTARFFLLFTRPNQKYAVIDTHILKFMRDELQWQDAPKVTPSKAKYKELEERYVKYLESIGVTDFAKFDLEKWSQFAK